jgi:hypothetical protein
VRIIPQIQASRWTPTREPWSSQPGAMASLPPLVAPFHLLLLVLPLPSLSNCSNGTWSGHHNFSCTPGLWHSFMANMFSWLLHCVIAHRMSFMAKGAVGLVRIRNLVWICIWWKRTCSGVRGLWSIVYHVVSVSVSVYVSWGRGYSREPDSELHILKQGGIDFLGVGRRNRVRSQPRVPGGFSARWACCVIAMFCLWSLNIVQ